ncbi:MAG: HDIG domain-containing protein [Tissierellia bacterium]|nr:HDIG domain-containing protein [Tissierellia bacterium]
MKTNSRKKLNIIALLVYSLTLLLIFNIFYKEATNISLGEVVAENIVSKETFENKEATELKKAQARNSVANVYKVIPNISIETKNKISNLNKSIGELRYTRDMTKAEKLRYLKSNSPLILEDSSFEFLIAANTEVISNIVSISTDLLSGTFNRGVRESNLSSELELLIASVDDLEKKEKANRVIKNILTSALIPNEIIDDERTAQLKAQAEEQVEPVIVETGDIILLKGETITEDKLDLLLLSGNKVTDGNMDVFFRFAPYIFIIILTFIYTLYLYTLEETIYLSSKFYILLLSNLLGILMSVTLSNISIVLIPALLIALIVSFYIDRGVVLINGLYLSILISYFEDISVAGFIYLNLIGILVVIFANKKNTRYTNFVVSVGVTLASAILYNILTFNHMEDFSFWLNILLAAGTGIVYMILAIGMSFIWENAFKILTPNRLQELSDTNQPLLKLLVEKAPGTYQHSLMVSNLAESAAMEIGADYQLVKAGALYHDIGKLTNPEYFKENQFGIENPHNELAPIESAKIILGHVENGKLLAKKYGLPQKIVTFIEEHHGDTMVSYFYYQAKLDDDDVDESPFKYKGKKPQTVETAIVMMADSCEAAVRSIKNKTEQNIIEMINNVVDGKIKDRQFIECDLSFSDVEKIKADMFKSLKSIYHERIEYPSEEIETI